MESKGLSNEKIKPPTTSANSLAPKLNWIHSLKIAIESKGSCLTQDTAILTLRNVVNLFIDYDLDTWSQDLKTDFTSKDCSFGDVNLTKNADPDKHFYSGYDIRFHSCSLFHFQILTGVKMLLLLRETTVH